MSTKMGKLLVLVFLCLLGIKSDRNQYPLATFVGFYPADRLDLGVIPRGTHIKVTITYIQPITSLTYFRISSGANLFVLRTVVTSQQSDTFTAVAETDSTGLRYWLYFTGQSYYQQCLIQVELDQVVARIIPKVLMFSYEKPRHRITVANGCRIKITYTGQPLGLIRVYDLPNIISIRNGAEPFATLFSTPGIVDLPSSGDYHIVIMPRQLNRNSIPYMLTVTTFCDGFCVNPSNPVSPPACVACGDGVLDQGEECDNGNRPGCNGCLVVKGYKCQGNVGGSSFCRKQALCGDGVLDQGEECDNGNQPGCSANCKIDAGYKCTPTLGTPSVCSLCGNGIVEAGEECDNKNGLGCSQNCKFDTGFICRGLAPSVCFRNNPVCGNGVIEVGESCDDGNKVTGDGCSSTCLIESGFTCTGEPSKCSKKPVTSPVCGNSVFEANNNEQCDNGNKEGCFGCVVQPGWQCLNLLGFPSVCLPKVVIPHCGNGVFEPLQNEACDDGNTVNGDGCNYFCQIEFGWVCIDNKKCVNTQDQPKVLCGNGNVDTAYGETCDDGNTLNGDGCSNACKVENGWDCKTYSPMQKRSYCAKQANGSGFCGDGVVQGNEECDDGFPLKNGDGCSTDCRKEPGWNCGSVSNNQVSNCWRI